MFFFRSPSFLKIDREATRKSRRSSEATTTMTPATQELQGWPGNEGLPPGCDGPTRQRQ
jgi:hypothetical protein